MTLVVNFLYLRDCVKEHEAIFNSNCKGPVTCLVVKDRVLAHNPLGAVYSRYWRRKLGIMEDGEV